MHKRYGISFLLSLLFFVNLSLVYAMEPAAGKNDLALDFKLQDMDKNTYVLSSYRGRQPVILFFWTTWCPFCRKELKLLENSRVELTKEGWAILPIDVGEGEGKVRSFLKANNIGINVLMDKDTDVASVYDILGVPTFIFINKEGRIIFRDNYFPQARLKELIKQ